MSHLKLLAGISITLVTVACGGAKQAPPAAHGADAPGGDFAPKGAPGYSPVDENDSGGGSFQQPTTSAPAPAAAAEAGGRSEGRSADRAAEPEPSRPGLATQWGETRSSRITTSPFFREDSRRPAAMAKVFYNDHFGARTMASRRGFVDLDSAEFDVASGAITVSLRDSSGRPLPAFRSESRNFAVGESGQRYVIHIQNHTGSRLEAVATVDGLDVIDGRDGSLGKRGYIVSPFSSVEIDGFRQSFDSVAAFRFGSVSSSYAARKGKGRNVGVIGIAFFQERGSRWPWDASELRRRETADPFPGGFARPPR